MRWAVALIAFVCLVGCGDRGASGPDGDRPSNPGDRNEEPIEPAALLGEYTGELTGEIDPKDSPLPPSIRTAIGDASLELKNAGRFAMVYKWLNLEGTYEIEGHEIVLSVESIEGLKKGDLAGVDLEANKKAGKQPTDEDTLVLFHEIFGLTDWRFKAEGESLTQLNQGKDAPRLKFTRKSG